MKYCMQKFKVIVHSGYLHNSVHSIVTEKIVNKHVDSWQHVLNYTITFYMLNSFTERIK